jgi:dephospho-CoA kinase
MIVVGLTGSIAMGKSETARMFRSLGVPVFDSDAEVHRLYGKGGAAVAIISEQFPTAVSEGAVNREALAELVMRDPQALKRVEAAVHPMVEEAQRKFLDCCRGKGCDIAVVDIPLLFETGSETTVDVIVVASAPEEVQRKRAFERSGMTEEKFANILRQQTPDECKRRRADFIVDTSRGYEDARAQVLDIVAALRSRIRSGNDARGDRRHRNDRT